MQSRSCIMFGLSLLLCFVNFSDALQISARKGPQRPQQLPAGLLVTLDRPSRLDSLALPEEEPTMPDNDAATKPESKQDEYRRKLAEAQVATVAAEEARRRLRHPPPPLSPPRATRAKLSKTDAGTLIIELPPTGLNSGTIFSGAFSIAWFSVVLPATTFSGMWLFMLPFWVAGALVAKQAVVDPFVTSKLTIGQYAWSLKSIYGGRNGITLSEKEGATDDLRSARPDLIAVVNGMPHYDIKLYDSTGATSLPMGTQVSEEELEYLVDEINNHLRELQDMPDPGLLRPGS